MTPGPGGPYDEKGDPRNLVGALARPYPRSVSGVLGPIEAEQHRLTFEVDPSGDREATVYLPRDFASGSGQSDLSVRGAEVAGWDEQARILELEMTPNATRVTITPAA